MNTIKFLPVVALLISAASVYGMETSNNVLAKPASRACLRKVVTDPATGDRRYIGTYPFESNRGLVTIKYFDLWQKICPQVNICRHRNKEVVIEAYLTYCAVQKYDKTRYFGDHPQLKEYVSNPCEDDTIKEDARDDEPALRASAADCSKPVQYDTVRGGNRLELKLYHFASSYFITVPHDADINVELCGGDVKYCSEEPTDLYVEATAMNNIGTHNIVKGDILCAEFKNFLKSKYNPKTTIKTKKGRVEV